MNGGRYDRWTDAYGVPITEAARVEQVKADPAHGAATRRKGLRGVVTGFGYTRVAVRFDGENGTVPVRPYLLGVIEHHPGSEAVGHLEDPVEGFHWHVYSRTTLEELTAPTPADRQARLAVRPDLVLRSPIRVAEWITQQAANRGERHMLWYPAAGRWIPYNDSTDDSTDGRAGGSGGRDILHLDAVQLAARAHNIYLATYLPASDPAGPRFEVFAEGVTTFDCPEGRCHDDPEQHGPEQYGGDG